MNWEQKVYVDFNQIKLEIEKGYKHLLNTDGSGYVDSDKAELQYQIFDDLDLNSYYKVGFNFGVDLINMHSLNPDLKIGGMTWFDNSVAFGQRLFGVRDYGFDLTVGEYPYKPIKGEWDLIDLGSLPHKSNLRREILEQACKDTKRYVFFYALPGEKYTYSNEFSNKEFYDTGLDVTPVLLTKITQSKSRYIPKKIETPTFEVSDKPYVEYPLDLLKYDTDEETDPLINDGVIDQELDEFFKREAESDESDK